MTDIPPPDDLIRFAGPWTPEERAQIREAARHAEANGLARAVPHWGAAWIAIKDNSASIYAATRQRVDRGFTAQSADQLARRIRALGHDDAE